MTRFLCYARAFSCFLDFIILNLKPICRFSCFTNPIIYFMCLEFEFEYKCPVLPCDCERIRTVLLSSAVCPSVRPSVKCVSCDKMKESFADIWKENSSSFPTRRMVGESILLYLTFWVKLAHPASKTAISNRYSLVAPQPLQLAKKSWIMTNRKSTTRFSMSLRWTAYVAPISSPEGGSNTQIDRFSSKSVLISKNVCCRVSLCENFQLQVVRHSLAPCTNGLWGTSHWT